MEGRLHRQTRCWTPEQLRLHADTLERWCKQLRFKADLMTQHTLTGLFICQHLGN